MSQGYLFCDDEVVLHLRMFITQVGITLRHWESWDEVPPEAFAALRREVIEVLREGPSPEGALANKASPEDDAEF